MRRYSSFYRGCLSILLFVTILSIVGCDKASSWTRISDDQLEDVLYDLYVAEGLMETFDYGQLPDSSRVAIRESVYRKHSITRMDLDSTVFYMTTNRMNLFGEICNKAMSRAKQYQEEYLQPIKDISNPEGWYARKKRNAFEDSLRIFPLGTHFSLVPADTFSLYCHQIRHNYQYNHPASLLLSGFFCSTSATLPPFNAPDQLSLSLQLCSSSGKIKTSISKPIQAKGYFSLELPIDSIATDDLLILSMHIHPQDTHSLPSRLDNLALTLRRPAFTEQELQEEAMGVSANLN